MVAGQLTATITENGVQTYQPPAGAYYSDAVINVEVPTPVAYTLREFIDTNGTYYFQPDNENGVSFDAVNLIVDVPAPITTIKSVGYGIYSYDLTSFIGPVANQTQITINTGKAFCMVNEFTSFYTFTFVANNTGSNIVYYVSTGYYYKQLTDGNLSPYLTIKDDNNENVIGLTDERTDNVGTQLNLYKTKYNLLLPN